MYLCIMDNEIIFDDIAIASLWHDSQLALNIRWRLCQFKQADITWHYYGYGHLVEKL